VDKDLVPLKGSYLQQSILLVVIAFLVSNCFRIHSAFSKEIQLVVKLRQPGR
jgi:hypothetical protein